MTSEPTNAWKDKHRLYELYWGELLSIHEVADELGTSYETVRLEMIDQGIPRRDSRRASHEPPTVGFEVPDRTVTKSVVELQRKW